MAAPKHNPRIPCSKCGMPIAQFPARNKQVHEKNCWGEAKIDSQDTWILHAYWAKKRQNSSKTNKGRRIDVDGNPIQFLLTGEDMISLCEEAGITPSQIGNKRDQYNLSRFGDSGHYTRDNCRFITKQENTLEKHRTTKQRAL